MLITMVVLGIALNFGVFGGHFSSSSSGKKDVTAVSVPAPQQNDIESPSPNEHSEADIPNVEYGNYRLGMSVTQLEELPMPPTDTTSRMTMPRLCKAEQPKFNSVICSFMGASLLPFTQGPKFTFYRSNDDLELIDISGEIDLRDADLVGEALSKKYGIPMEAKPLNSLGKVHYEWSVGDCTILIKETGSGHGKLQFTNSRKMTAMKQFADGVYKRSEEEEEQKRTSEHFAELQKKALNGEVESQKNLANCYWKGSGCVRDESKAIYWLNLAAKQHDRDAILSLAILVENKDPAYASDLYREIFNSDDGHENLKDKLCELYRKIPPEVYRSKPTIATLSAVDKDLYLDISSLISSAGQPQSIFEGQLQAGEERVVKFEGPICIYSNSSSDVLKCQIDGRTETLHHSEIIAAPNYATAPLRTESSARF